MHAKHLATLAALCSCMLTQCGYSTSDDEWYDKHTGEHSSRKQLVEQMDGAYLPLKSTYNRLYETFRDNAVTIEENNAKLEGISEGNKEAIGVIKERNSALEKENEKIGKALDGIEDIAARAYFIRHLREYGIDVLDEQMEKEIDRLLSETP